MAVSVFDIFAGPKAEAQMGPGQKSMAIAVRLQPVERTLTEADIEAAVRSALDGGPLVLTDDKGRRVMVPAGALGYVEVGEPSRGRVGFGA